MSEVFWFTGLIVWIAAALYGAILLVWAAWCAVVAVDWTIWAIKVDEGEVIWRRVPGAFLRRWVEFIRWGPASFSFQNSHGYWNGFRDWANRPPA